MAGVMVTVVNTPDAALVVTNLAYVAPGSSLSRVQLLEIGELVFTVAQHPAIPPQSVGLNMIQRKALRVSGGDSVTVSAFQLPPMDTFGIAMLSAELEYVQKRRSPTQTEVDAKALAKHIQSRYSGQVLSDRQELVMEFQGEKFFLRVRSIVVIDKKGEQASVPRGAVVPLTAFVFDANTQSGIKVVGQRSAAAPQLFKSKEFNFEKLGIGGLDAQFDQIFRRAFASRVFPPEMVERLGIRHVKGVLLYGPPGTGKTLIARQIGKMLNGKEPKIVNGPEVLNKFVGESEANVRKLFEDAEADQKQHGDASELHVIIFDEIDAICKSRGSVSSGSGVHDTLVNQLLTKIDGVDSLNNILLIGMTNRKDMLDEALLRPGRLEVQVEIGLPDDKGRLQILKIHTNKMATNSFMSKDVDLWELASRTKNFSGAEIEGLVKSAVSFALNRQVDVSDLSKPIDEENIKVAMEDFVTAMQDVKPAFGAVIDTLEMYRLNGIIDYGDSYRHLASTCHSLVAQDGVRNYTGAVTLLNVLLVCEVRNSSKTPLMTCLLEGPPGTGKTALAATVGIDSDFPFVKVISAENYVGWGEQAKCSAIAKVFDDAYKSPMSIVILDDIERLLEYVAIGPRFSNTILQTLLVLLKKIPPEGRKLLVLGTTSVGAVMQEMDVSSAFNVVLHVPMLRESQIGAVMQSLQAFAPEDVEMALATVLGASRNEFAAEVPIKRLLLLLEMARQGHDDEPQVAVTEITLERWTEVIRDLAS